MKKTGKKELKKTQTKEPVKRIRFRPLMTSLDTQAGIVPLPHVSCMQKRFCFRDHQMRTV